MSVLTLAHQISQQLDGIGPGVQGVQYFTYRGPSHEDPKMLIGGNFIYAIIYPIFITAIACNQVVAALCSHYVHIRNVFTAFHERK